MTNETDRHLLNQDGLDQADSKIGLDVLPYDFVSVPLAAWFVKGLMSCNRHDIEEIGKCRHWMAINGLIKAVRQEVHDA